MRAQHPSPFGTCQHRSFLFRQSQRDPDGDRTGAGTPRKGSWRGNTFPKIQATSSASPDSPYHLDAPGLQISEWLRPVSTSRYLPRCESLPAEDRPQEQDQGRRRVLHDLGMRCQDFELRKRSQVSPWTATVPSATCNIRAIPNFSTSFHWFLPVGVTTTTTSEKTKTSTDEKVRS